MASLSHCAYCFEVLSAKFDGRQTPSLAAVDKLWNQYIASSQDQKLRPHAIDRLTAIPSPINSSSSVSPAPSAASSTPSLASSATSQASTVSPSDKYPLFVSWDKESARSGQKSLRGCIGTFEARSDLNDTLKSYAQISYVLLLWA
jgi:hypothetical protein